MRKRVLCCMMLVGCMALNGCGGTTGSAPGNQETEAGAETPGTDGSGQANEGQGEPGQSDVPGDGKPEGGPGSGPLAPDSYNAVTEFREDTKIPGGSYVSEGKDENAVLVSNGAFVELSDFSLTRTSEESTGGDEASFYGIGAGLLTIDGTLTVHDADISTDAEGGTGVFGYGDGTVNIANSVIRTEKGTSGGIHVAGGGTLHAQDLTVETKGASSAAIRSDRGGGTMTVQGGSYTSHGEGSPAVYCTADIEIADADLNATGAEAICMEGLNRLKLENCEVSGNIPQDERNDCDWTVILYQSMSGDAEVGSGMFEMTGGRLVSKNGGMFYTTNTESSFLLDSVMLEPSENSDFFLRCTGNANKRGWGESGANGADCTFSIKNMQVEGDVVWDSISTLAFVIEDQSTLTGAFLQDESCAGGGGDGFADLTVEKGCTWIVTADSFLTSLQCDGKIQDEEGNSVTVKATDGTIYVQGEGDITVMVDPDANMNANRVSK